MSRPWLLAAALALLVLVIAQRAPTPARAEGSKETCGEAVKFGHQFEVRVGGEPIGCREALEIIDRPCTVRLKHEWSCFSFRESYPFIVWFPSEEMFARDWSTVVTYKRFPCAEAVLTRDLFAPAPRGFPTRRQLLADDVIRCGLLEGMTLSEVRRLLGPPTYRSGGRSLGYDIGLERDSFFQVDNEVLAIGFSKRGIYSGASIYQS